MPKYRFTAVDSKGKEITGTVEAANEEQVNAAIREQGYFPTNVSAAGGKPALKKKKQPARSSSVKGGKTPKSAANKKGEKKGFLSSEINIPSLPSRIKPKDLMVFTRQLATLVDAGLPLVRGMEVLNKQEKNPTMKKAIVSMIESISTGSTFAEALMHHPKIFDKLYVNMVRAGELGGVLDTVLLSLSVFMEKVEKIKSKVISAMVYPCVVLFMAVAIVIFLMVFIIPKFEKIFEDILEGEALPTLTLGVLAVSKAITSYLHYVLLGVVLLVIAVKLLAKTKGGHYAIDKMKLHAPLFGSLFLKSGIARFTRTLGTLMNSGVPVLQALSIVRETSGNAVMANAINVVHDSVKEGENMAPPLESTKIFPPMVIGMVEVGEETGELPQMLTRVADNYEEEVDNAVASITSIIEPVLIVLLAVIVGTIVIALFLPLIKIISNLSG